MTDLTIVKGKRTPAQRVLGFFGKGFVNFALIVVALLWVIPSLGLLLTSFRTVGDSTTSGWWTVFTKPAQLTLQNYVDLLSNSAITSSLLNSILIVVPATLLVVLVGALAGYAFAWMEFPGRDWLLVAVIVLLAVPLQVALIPVARLFGWLGIFGSIPGVILFHVAFGLPFAIFLLRNFFTQIPREVLEAARVDGASEWRIFVRVILPLGAPAIASRSPSR